MKMGSFIRKQAGLITPKTTLKGLWAWFQRYMICDGTL